MDKPAEAVWSAFKAPEQSGWKCYMFGSKPPKDNGPITISWTGLFIYTPTKGNVPNFFVRWMMKVCLGCTWVKEKRNANT